MKPGSQVIPVGFPKDSRPGTVKLVCGKKVVVTWRMGSTGWANTVTHNLNEIEEVEAVCAN